MLEIEAGVCGVNIDVQREFGLRPAESEEGSAGKLQRWIESAETALAVLAEAKSAEDETRRRVLQAEIRRMRRQLAQVWSG